MKKTSMTLLTLVIVVTIAVCGCQSVSNAKLKAAISKADAEPLAKQAAINAYEEKYGRLEPPAGSTSDGVSFVSIQEDEDKYYYKGFVLVSCEPGYLGPIEISIEMEILKQTGEITNIELG